MCKKYSHCILQLLRFRLCNPLLNLQWLDLSFNQLVGVLVKKPLVALKPQFHHLWIKVTVEPDLRRRNFRKLCLFFLPWTGFTTWRLFTCPEIASPGRGFKMRILLWKVGGSCGSRHIGGVCCVCRQVTTSVKLKKNMLESVFGLPQALELVPEIVVFCLNGKTGLQKVQSLYLAALEV